MSSSDWSKRQISLDTLSARGCTLICARSSAAAAPSAKLRTEVHKLRCVRTCSPCAAPIEVGFVAGKSLWFRRVGTSDFDCVHETNFVLPICASDVDDGVAGDVHGSGACSGENHLRGSRSAAGGAALREVSSGTGGWVCVDIKWQLRCRARA